MGRYAKAAFGRDHFSSVGIALAGSVTPEHEQKVLSLFDEVVYSKDSVFHTHLVKKENQYYSLIVNVYGAPAMIDSMAIMYDGGCRNIIFVGYAYAGFKKNLEVGSIVLSHKVYHFDGIYSPFDPSKFLTTPNVQLHNTLKSVLEKNNQPYTIGKNISVPSVTFQLPHANEHYRKVDPLTVEMELASCFSRARDIGMRAAGILIISDNRESHIADENKKMVKRKAQLRIIEMVVNNLPKFKLPTLKGKKFDIDEHLASIIELPEDKRNIYKK
ncbi:MAG: hypothetical protein Q8R37_02975 [Nanoarchaeota archaeon]|nr:hypothetical protein [Nanoarchaeota archaeon]